jgi:hypothetical protein
MNRRAFLTGVGGGAVGVLTGCTESSPTPQSDSEDGTPSEAAAKNPIAVANPWQGTIVHFTGDTAAPEQIRAAYDTEVPRILTGAAVTTAFVASENTRSVESTAQTAGFEIHALTAATWEGGPVCDVRNWIQFPTKPSEEEVRETFPDAVSVFLSSSASGGKAWTVYTPLINKKEISDKLEILRVGAEASFATYQSCNTGEATETTTPA